MSARSTPDLLAAVDRVIEAARRVTKEQRIAPLEKAAERRFAALFRQQGRLFRAEIAAIPPEADDAPITDAQISAIMQKLELVLIGTLPDQRAAFETTIESGFGAGIQDAIEQLGYDPGLLWPILSLGSARVQEADGDGGFLFNLAFNLSSWRAREYIETRSASLVTAVSDTTRNRIRQMLIEGFDNSWSYDRVAREIINIFPEMAIGKPQLHIDSRAHLIAVTEIGNAYCEGSYQSGRQLVDAGIEMQKYWSTVGDDRVSEGCQANEDADWIAYDEAFPSGHQKPLRFPGCRCDILMRPVV